MPISTVHAHLPFPFVVPSQELLQQLKPPTRFSRSTLSSFETHPLQYTQTSKPSFSITFNSTQQLVDYFTTTQPDYPGRLTNHNTQVYWPIPKPHTNWPYSTGQDNISQFNHDHHTTSEACGPPSPPDLRRPRIFSHVVKAGKTPPSPDMWERHYPHHP